MVNKQDTGQATERVTPSMIEALRATKPWVRLVSVAGFAVSAVSLLTGLAVTAGVFQGHPADATGIVTPAVYLLMAVVYFLPALLLFRYASAIRRLVRGELVPAMEEALQYQRAFWRLVGILVLTVAVLYAMGMLLSLDVGSLLGPAS
jgi:hypothetical protein